MQAYHLYPHCPSGPASRRIWCNRLIAHAACVSADPSPKPAPNIVCVLPEPVWPYARIVALYPLSNSVTDCAPICSNVCYWFCVASTIPSNRKRSRSPSLTWCNVWSISRERGSWLDRVGLNLAKTRTAEISWDIYNKFTRYNQIGGQRSLCILVWLDDRWLFSEMIDEYTRIFEFKSLVIKKIYCTI